MNIAIIPARSGSKRIKNKNIKLFFGKPMIYWTIVAAKKSKLFDRIIVSTDSKRIAEISLDYGAEVPFYRSKKLSDDKTNVSDVIKDVLKNLIKINQRPNYACLLYATSPLINIKDLINGYSKLKKKNFDFVTSVSKFDSQYFRALKIKNQRISPKYKKYVFTRSQNLESLYFDNAQFTFGKVNAWLKNKHIFLAKTSFIEIPSFRVQDIDTSDDWKKAEILFKMLNKKNIK
jgi:pseudaminic acid cytidylyltransferase